MKDESTSANIEWKKDKKFENKEHLTLKTNLLEAVKYQKKEKNPIKISNNLNPDALPKGLKKIRKKIKEVYDEEDDDDFYIDANQDLNNSLLNALYEDEKIKVQQQNTLKNHEMQQSAGKMEAVLVANKISNDVGLGNVKKHIAEANMQDALQNDLLTEKILAENISSKTNHNLCSVSDNDALKMLKGINRIKKMTIAADGEQIKSIKDIKTKDIINAGENTTDDREVAKLILKKSGRKNKKNINKIVEKNKNIKAPKITSKQIDKQKLKQKIDMNARDNFRQK